MNAQELIKIFGKLKGLDDEKPHDISSDEINISKNLDLALQTLGADLFNLNINTLYNIFFNPQRELTDHNSAYDLIKVQAQKEKKTQIFILLPSIDGTKLSKENIKDAILNKNKRYGLIPQIDLYMLNIIEKHEEEITEIKNNYAKNNEINRLQKNIDDTNDKINKYENKLNRIQPKIIKTCLFFLLSFGIILSYLYNGINQLYSDNQFLKNTIDSLKNHSKIQNNQIESIDSNLKNKIELQDNKYEAEINNMHNQSKNKTLQ